MTPAQLEHLKLIDAHLERLLAIAAKRTPGEWVAGWNMIGDGVANTVCNAPMRNPQMTSLEWVSDKQFIASCAGNTEAGWKATRAAITLLFSMVKRQHDIETAKAGFDALESILAAFPLELVKP